MTELRDELFAMPMHDWRFVPITVSRHKWWLIMYRFEGNANYYFCFVSPRGRRYSFRTGRGKGGCGRVTDADVELATGETIASYWQGWCDTAERMDAVIRLTPRHIIDRLMMLLDAIG